MLDGFFHHRLFSLRVRRTQGWERTSVAGPEQRPRQAPTRARALHRLSLFSPSSFGRSEEGSEGRQVARVGGGAGAHGRQAPHQGCPPIPPPRQLPAAPPLSFLPPSHAERAGPPLSTGELARAPQGRAWRSFFPRPLSRELGAGRQPRPPGLARARARARARAKGPRQREWGMPATHRARWGSDGNGTRAASENHKGGGPPAQPLLRARRQGVCDCRGFLPFSPQGCHNPGSSSALSAPRGRGEKNRGSSTVARGRPRGGGTRKPFRTSRMERSPL